MEIKTIHYCWFGGKELPETANKCINSWKKYFPDYEIKRWDESNFNIDIIPYTQQAYKAKKYAFVSDYARFWIIYNFGGIYFDTDVEVIRSMKELVNRGPFMGCENEYIEGCDPFSLGINPGLGIGAPPGLNIYQEILEKYASLKFDPINLKTVVSYTTEFFVANKLKASPKIQKICDIYIYPKEYLCPINYKTKECLITSNTVSIHHYAESWHGPRQKLFKLLRSIIGKRFANQLSTLWKKIHKKLKF